MTDFTQDFFSARRNFADGITRIGTTGKLWYDSTTNSIRVSDGITPGGIEVGGSGGSGYTLLPAQSGRLGGVKIGGNITVAGDGTISVLKPTAVSQLSNDAGYITISSVPTALSALTNDVGFTTTSIMLANVAAANASIQTISANLGAYQIWANANVAGLSSNAGVQGASLLRLDANLGTATTNISNLVTQANANTTALLAGSVTTGPLTVDSRAGGYFANISGDARPSSGRQSWRFWTNMNIGGPASYMQFPDSTNQFTAYPGTATTLTLSGLVSAGSITSSGDVGVTGNINLTGNIIPTSTNTYNLGSPGAKWANVFIGPGSLYLTDTVTANTVALTATNNVLFLNGFSGLTNGNLYFNQNSILTLTPNVDITVGNVSNDTGNLVVNRSTNFLRDTHSANIFATGNVTARYFIGDATFLTNVAPAVQQYLFANIASSVSPYYQSIALSEYSGSLTTGTVTVTVTGTVKGAGTLLASFLTNVGHPNILTLPAGFEQFTFETTKASGNAGYICYVELYKRTAAGTETKLATSDSTSEVTQNGAIAQQTVGMFIASPITMAVTDRLLVKVYAYKSSGSGNPSITLTFGDNTNSGYQIGLLPPTVNNFVPYTNATNDVDLGSYQLTTTGNITGGNASITSNLVVSQSGLFRGPYNENSTLSGVFVGNTGTAPGITPRVGFFNGNTQQNWQLDNNGGEFRWFVPGSTKMTLYPNGNLNVIGSLTLGGKKAVNGPAFSAYANATGQTITSGSQQKVLFQTEEFDTDNCYTNSRFTPTVEGYYQLNAEVRLDGASGTGEMMIVIWKNGAEHKRGTNQSGTQIASNFWAMTVSSLVYANGTGDYFEIYVQQGSGGNVTVTAVNGINITWFNGAMVRGAY